MDKSCNGGDVSENAQEQSVQSGGLGNDGELLVVESELVLLIDQFMLGNSQFIAPLAKFFSGSESVATNDEFLEHVANYGGAAIALPKGSYRAYRDPYKRIIVVYPADEVLGTEDEESQATLDLEQMLKSKPRDQGSVYIDTRCLVITDSNLLRNGSLLKRFAEQRAKGKDKDGRDLLREHGAMVRYGFQRYGDELGVFNLADGKCIALWPDVSARN